MEDIFGFADDLGPTKIIHVYEPSVGLKASDSEHKQLAFDIK